MTPSTDPQFHRSRRAPRRAALTAAALAGVALVAAACGGGNPTPAASRTASNANTSNTTPRTPLPGAFGQVAAVSGETLEVQNPQSGQVTVNLNGSTVVTQTVAASPGDLSVGDCVVANGTKDASGRVAANAVTISQAGPSGCTRDNAFGGGFGGFGGFGGRRAGSGAPSGAPSGTTRPTRPANFAVSIGKVVAVNGPTVQVEVPPSSSTSTTRAGRTPITPASSFTFSSATRWSKVVTVGPSAVAVGQCVSAFGPSDNTGAVTARRLTLRPAGPNGCFAGFGRDGGPGGGVPTGAVSQ